MSDETVGRILALLDSERQMLLRGGYGDLAGLLETKVQLFDTLASTAPSRADVKTIRRKLAENQSLLSAAMRGVGAARDRLTALQNVREQLNTYDQSGRLARVSTTRPAVTRKA